MAAEITRPGHTIDMAVMHFLLFYGGVFALIGLTAAVGVGLLAADRIVMTPNRRIIAQAVHRAVSFGAVGFLVIHIATEVIAGRAQAADAVVPFVGQPRTLYLGFGTLASDLFLLILVTGIMRGRFAAIRPPWVWRALHVVAYLAWPLGILHGLLDGRTAKPYVYWSYGACAASVGVALVVRLVVAARVREVASNPVPAAAPWLTAGGAAPWLPGGSVTRSAPPGRAVPPGRSVPPAPPGRSAPPGRAMPAHPGHPGSGGEYNDQEDPANYYPGADDEDYEPEWADAEDLDAEDYHPEPLAGEYDPEWADAEDDPGPVRPYPHRGWAR